MKSTTFITPTFRAAFPSLMSPSAFGNEEPRYSVTAIFSPQDAQSFQQQTVAIYQQLCQANFTGVQGIPMPQLKDGNTNIDKNTGQPKLGFPGNHYIKLANTDQPHVVDPTGAFEIPAKDLYAGCYARAIVEVWAQDNGYGQRVNFKLIHVQKVSDGEPFGRAPVNPLEAFGAAPGAPAGTVAPAGIPPAGAPMGAQPPAPQVQPGMPPTPQPAAQPMQQPPVLPSPGMQPQPLPQAQPQQPAQLQQPQMPPQGQVPVGMPPGQLPPQAAAPAPGVPNEYVNQFMGQQPQ